MICVYDKTPLDPQPHPDSCHRNDDGVMVCEFPEHSRIPKQCPPEIDSEEGVLQFSHENEGFCFYDELPPFPKNDFDQKNCKKIENVFVCDWNFWTERCSNVSAQCEKFKYFASGLKGYKVTKNGETCTITDVREGGGGGFEFSFDEGCDVDKFSDADEYGYEYFQTFNFKAP